MLENTKWAIKNGQTRDTGNIDNNKTKKNKAKTQRNMSWIPLCTTKHNMPSYKQLLYDMVIVVTLTDIGMHLNSIMTLIGWFARLINNVDCADISCPLNFKMKSEFSQYER